MKYRMLIMITLLLTVTAIAQDKGQDNDKKEKMKFTHPSIMVNEKEIKDIKQAIKSGVEPQTSAFGHLTTAAQEYLQGKSTTTKEVSYTWLLR